jgi:hypothetical protein
MQSTTQKAAAKMKWQPGDTVWSADFGWHRDVEVQSAIVKSVGKVQVVLPDRLHAFGFALRVDANKVYGSAAEALEALLSKEEAELPEARERLNRVERRIAAARAALAKETR